MYVCMYVPCMQMYVDVVILCDVVYILWYCVCLCEPRSAAGTTHGRSKHTDLRTANPIAHRPSDRCCWTTVVKERERDRKRKRGERKKKEHHTRLLPQRMASVG